ncbi:MerR family transcriptional regulator [Bacillus sp. Bva_UNVM-123]|uniref:MerR family transcriptional regulator n=1 Tax=Bacillus sp. Bva_UNVM-123 TaxID=2829798 RepID=UPI00391FBCE6
MNTATVAKLLKVSPSTIQRWVKQLDLDMERNELGHYIFTEEDITLLKNVQEQINNGIILQDVTIKKKKVRKGKLNTPVNTDGMNDLLAKIELIEHTITQKADGVVSYQLLQHRREIEDLQNDVLKLTERIESLQLIQNEMIHSKTDENVIIFDKKKPNRKLKKKNIISSLFGF